jgi:hypothetical protein
MRKSIVNNNKAKWYILGLVLMISIVGDIFNHFYETFYLCSYVN